MTLLAGVRNVEHVGLDSSEEAESEAKIKRRKRDRETEIYKCLCDYSTVDVFVYYSLHIPKHPLPILVSLLPCFSPSESESDSGTRVLSDFWGVACSD